MRSYISGMGVVDDINKLSESEKDFIISLHNGNSDYPKILSGRICEFTGVMYGWAPNENDSLFTLEDNTLDNNGIVLADRFSNILSNKDPFYVFDFSPKGPPALLPWIFTFIIEYAIAKGLDYVIDKLKEKDPKDLAKELSIKWGNNNGDSLGQLEVTFSDGRSFKIENYPHSIDRITVKQIEQAKIILSKENDSHVIYDAWGRISVYRKDEYGNRIDIKL